ncbi:hypothetical protein HanPI659440_Chr17g0687261 [Helianthus annuus]|nr:hypothetical protein HanPI659440_Chr17g0687261 [Helianthus annuus]
MCLIFVNRSFGWWLTSSFKLLHSSPHLSFKEVEAEQPTSFFSLFFPLWFQPASGRRLQVSNHQNKT